MTANIEHENTKCMMFLYHINDLPILEIFQFINIGWCWTWWNNVHCEKHYKYTYKTAGSFDVIFEY